MKEKTYKCVLCGRISPNPFGECLCSYEEVMLSGEYKKIAIRLAKITKQLLKI